MLQSSAKIKLQAVPYRGAGPAIADLIGGQVNAMSAEVPVLMPQIKAGKAKILAISAQSRSDVMPDVPTFAELGYADVVADNWSGVLAPPKTPAAIVDKINAGVNEALRDPDVQKRLADLSAEPVGGTPQATAAYFHDEVERWKDVIMSAHVTLE